MEGGQFNSFTKSCILFGKASRDGSYCQTGCFNRRACNVDNFSIWEGNVFLVLFGMSHVLRHMLYLFYDLGLTHKIV